MSSEDDDRPERYVHDPGGTDASAADVGGDEGMGRRGWVLLAAVVLAFFGAPAVVYLRPPGVPFEVAFLVVPLVPAFLLGTVAVWAMTDRR
ncbi:hypothetical protein BRD10_00910 [Halobacteriales archaeon SW_12_71_31]|nr:MAG: hypothetical protein BRD10_00910 [Halobacteriales archaeon SW_12_71_31]